MVKRKLSFMILLLKSLQIAWSNMKVQFSFFFIWLYVYLYIQTYISLHKLFFENCKLLDALLALLTVVMRNSQYNTDLTPFLYLIVFLPFGTIFSCICSLFSNSSAISLVRQFLWLIWPIAIVFFLNLPVFFLFTSVYNVHTSHSDLLEAQALGVICN